MRVMLGDAGLVTSVVLHQSIESCRLCILSSVRSGGLNLSLVLRLTWLNSSHCLNLSEGHRNNLAVTHVLEEDLRVANDQRVSDVQVVSIQPSLNICWHHRAPDHRLSGSWRRHLAEAGSVGVESFIILALT